MIRLLVLSFLAVGAFSASQRHFGNNISPQIAGGEEAVQGEFPYQLVVRRYSDHVQYCGASIINEEFVLTAASCVSGLHQYQLELVAGVLNVEHPSGHEEVYKVIRIMMYPNYNAQSGKHDIAILKVDRKFTFNENVAPIALPSKKYQESSGDCTVTGWGLSGEGEKLDVLQKVDVTVISDDECKDMYGFLGYKVSDSTLCASGPSKDSCKGDSGGPLKCTDKDGLEYQAGVVSWKLSCGNPRHPGIYTEVSHYVDWIKMNIR